MKPVRLLEDKRILTFSAMCALWRLNAKFIAKIVGVCVALALILTFIVPSTYKSYASIVPPENASAAGGLSSFLQSISGGLSIGGLGSDNKSLLLGDFIKSRKIAKYISDTLGLWKNPIYSDLEPELLYDLLDKSIEIKINRSGLIMLTAEASTSFFPSGEDMLKASKMSADIANTAIKGLNDVSREKTVSKARSKRIYIERMIAEKKIVLDSVDNELEKFQRENKAMAIEEQTKAILQASVEMGSELGKAEAEYSLKRFDYKNNSPSVQAAEQAVQSLREQYKRVQSGGILGNEDYSFALEKMPKLFRRYTNLIRDKKILEQVNLYLETQRYQEAIQEESDVPVIEALDWAIPPLKRESPSRMFAAILTALLSMFFVCGYIVIKAGKAGCFIVEEANEKA